MDRVFVVRRVGAVGAADFLKIAPLLAMTSGMRKAPPISISSPRETITSLPWAKVFNPEAAALLFTTVAASAPGQLDKESLNHFFTPTAFAGRQIVLQVNWEPATAVMASIAAWGSKARPSWCGGLYRWR